MSRKFGIGSGLALVLLLAVSCSDEKGGDDATQTGMQTIDVCATELAGECGDACDSDDGCPDGQFCSDGECTAECTPSVGCNGNCQSDGRCDGTLQTVVESPGAIDDGTILIADGETSGTSGNVSGGFEECATSSASGELTPVVMYVMFDRSSSMEQNNKWQDATGALQSFFEDPTSADLGVAYAVFPSEVNGCADPACDRGACAVPVVSLGTLTAEAGDPQEQALVQALVNDQPGDGSGRTPMDIALGGAVDWAVDYQDANPDIAAVVVLVTDGEPTGCNTNIGAIADIARSGFTDHDVRTYAIGLEGSNEGQMDQIASAGGTGDGIFIGGAGDAGQALRDALAQIRGEIASCDLLVPEPPNGATLNKDQVNVQLTLGGDAVVLAQVGGADDCGDDASWHYNNDETRILLCPAACDAVQADAASQIDVVLGCAANQVPPPIAR